MGHIVVFYTTLSAESGPYGALAAAFKPTCNTSSLIEMPYASQVNKWEENLPYPSLVSLARHKPHCTPIPTLAPPHFFLSKAVIRKSPPYLPFPPRCPHSHVFPPPSPVLGPHALPISVHMASVGFSTAFLVFFKEQWLVVNKHNQTDLVTYCHVFL